MSADAPPTAQPTCFAQVDAHWASTTGVWRSGYTYAGHDPGWDLVRIFDLDRYHPAKGWSPWSDAHHPLLFAHRQPPRQLGAPRAGYRQAARRRAREPPGAVGRRPSLGQPRRQYRSASQVRGSALRECTREPSPGETPGSLSETMKPTGCSGNVTEAEFNAATQMAERLAAQWFRRQGSKIPRGFEVGDALQAARLAVWSAAQSFDRTKGNQFNTLAHSYLFGCLQRAIRDYSPLRRRDFEAGRYDLAPQELDAPVTVGSKSSLGATVADSRPGPEAECLRCAVREQVEALPLKLRRVILLRYFEDRTLRESALLLGISANYVSVLEHKALRALRAMD